MPWRDQERWLRQTIVIWRTAIPWCNLECCLVHWYRWISPEMRQNWLIHNAECLQLLSTTLCMDANIRGWLKPMHIEWKQTHLNQMHQKKTSVINLIFVLAKRSTETLNQNMCHWIWLLYMAWLCVKVRSFKVTTSHRHGAALRMCRCWQIWTQESNHRVGRVHTEFNFDQGEIWTSICVISAGWIHKFSWYSIQLGCFRWVSGQ